MPSGQTSTAQPSQHATGSSMPLMQPFGQAGWSGSPHRRRARGTSGILSAGDLVPADDPVTCAPVAEPGTPADSPGQNARTLGQGCDPAAVAPFHLLELRGRAALAQANSLTSSSVRHTAAKRWTRLPKRGVRVQRPLLALRPLGLSSSRPVATGAAIATHFQLPIECRELTRAAALRAGIVREVGVEPTAQDLVSKPFHCINGMKQRDVGQLDRRHDLLPGLLPLSGKACDEPPGRGRDRSAGDVDRDAGLANGSRHLAPALGRRRTVRRLRYRG